jgi:hypothetical protein
VAVQFINSPEKNFASGIDARSAENQIPESFVKDLLNSDVVEKRVRKRRGYQSYAGNVPVRITRLDYDGATNEVCFTLDSTVALDTAVSLDQVRSSPIIVHGRSSDQATGPFNTSGDSSRYYPAFTVPTRKSFIAPSGTLQIDSTEHGLGTTNLFCSVVESTSLTNRSYTKVLTDSISIDDTSFDIGIGYTTYIDRDVFVYFSDKDPVGGSSYVATLNHTGSGLETFSIPTSTHNLTNYNIITQVQQDTGPTTIQVIPEQFLLANNGDVTISLDSVSAATYKVILSAAPVTNTASGVVNATSSGTVTISSPDKPWLFFGIYLEQTPGGTKELVYPDTIDYDSVTNQFTLSFTNDAAVARNFIVLYEYGDVRSNRLCVTDSLATVTGTDLAPQLTMWGLSHDEIYAEKVSREGWVNHIDSYRRSGEQRLICGLGGNLFSAQQYQEAASTYLYPTLYPKLFARSNSNLVLGPLFYDTSDTPGRSRGYITSDSSGTHWGKATSVQYDSGNGWTKYTLSLPNKLILDSTGTPTTLSSVISTTANLEDWLTVQDMSYSRHNGTFRIRQIVDGTDLIEVWVENPNNSSDYDDLYTGGEAGVFTDQITWIANGPFIPGDSLISSALGDTFLATVVSGSGTVTVIQQLGDLVEIPGGLLINVERSNSVIPLRESQPSNASSTTNLVRGDVLFYSGPDELNNTPTTQRLLRVKFINPDQDRTCDISGDGTTATLTMTSGDTSFLTSGQKILLLNAGKYTGTQTIESVDSSTQLSFLSSETVSVSGSTLAGETAEIDEDLTWSDTPGDANYFQVSRRWIPIEAPTDNFDLTPSTNIRYFDTTTYTDQDFIRSTMVQDNLYLTNNSDSVYKFDGSSNYRAGLPAWQPGLFATVDTAATAKIVTGLRSFSYSAITAVEGKLTITSTAVNSIPEGNTVRLTGSNQTYTLRRYTNDGTNYYAMVDRALDTSVSASGTVAEIGTYKYYFRLNAVDANDNIVASAITSSQDFAVELNSDAAINLKLIGLPVFGNYDYDRLEVQIYRTALNVLGEETTAPVYYLITTIPIDFDNTQGYISYTDSFSDSDINQTSNLDAVATNNTGSELGTNWSDPLRAKYITSIGNRLVLANFKDYPELSLQITGDANLSNSSFAGDTLLFLRDSQDTSTLTNMVNRVKMQWVNGFTGTASGFTIGTDDFSFTTSVATGAVAGDWIYLTYATTATTGRDLNYSGWWQIADVVGTTVTVNLVGAAASGTYPNRYVIATDPTDVPVLLGPDGNLGQVNGDSFDLFDSMRRMSLSINAVMRNVDISIPGMEGFTPWLQARGGNDLTTAGQLLVRCPTAEDTIPAIKPTFSGYTLFINSLRTTSGTVTAAAVRSFPSRLIVSYENYPELFDSPTEVLDGFSDSAIDVNPADGQEITGVIPFFGESAFTFSQQAQVLVVFKTNSVYLVDVNQKRTRRNPNASGNVVQRIETEGLGCTAPYSIAVTKNGVMFANESGIYCLRRNQAIQYIGKFMERNWTEKVDPNALQLAQGHHYGIGRTYKLSVATRDTEATTGYIQNSEVYVYNHTQEDEGQLGAWGRYDNHPATGWANLGSEAFFGSAGGVVYQLRNTGLRTDFRDSDEPILFRLDTRPMDFGNSGIRKILSSVTVAYRAGTNVNTENSLKYSVDLEQEYTETTPFNINQPTRTTGLSDLVGRDVVTIRHDTGRRRGLYFSIRIENSGMDENMEVAGIDCEVGGLSNKGILQAAQTK